MSVKVMAKIWENGPTSMPDRFVLLAIADHANDEGQAFPGVASLARKTCMTPRGVQKILRRLQTDGWLAIELRQGRFHCNLYTVLTPNTVHPQAEKEAQETLNGVHLHPEHGSLYPEPGSPKPSLTIKEPSVPPIVPQGGQEHGERANEPAQQAEPVAAKRERKPIADEQVAAIYAAYPRKVARAAAEKAIAKALTVAPAEVLQEAVTAYAAAVQAWPQDERQFVPHPATWFNARRWEDDRAEWKREPKRGLTPMRPEPVLRFV